MGLGEALLRFKAQLFISSNQCGDGWASVSSIKNPQALACDGADSFCRSLRSADTSFQIEPPHF